MSNYSDDMKTLLQQNSFQRYSEIDLFSTQGRMGQKHYFVYSIVIPFLLFWSIASLAGLLTHLGSIATQVSYFLLGIAIISGLFITIRFTIQRCHDFNRTGWLAIFAVIPLANIIFALIPGDNGLNQYGEVPEPANGLFKFFFYALIFVLFLSVLFLLFQLYLLIR